jgi:hypothetical protein
MLRINRQPSVQTGLIWLSQVISIDASPSPIALSRSLQSSAAKADHVTRVDGNPRTTRTPIGSSSGTGRHTDYAGFYAVAFATGIVFNIANLLVVGTLVFRRSRLHSPVLARDTRA